MYATSVCNLDSAAEPSLGIMEVARTNSNSPAATTMRRRTQQQGSGSRMSVISQLYSEDTLGIKIDPVTLLVSSLIYIGSVFALHIWGKYAA